MALYIGGTAVDATAAEIDVLDGLDRGSIIYGNASSATTVLGQGGADEVLTSDGTDIAWAAGGDVSKVGTPANNQVGIWTGDGTIEGDSNLTFDGSTLTVTPSVQTSGAFNKVGTFTSLADDNAFNFSAANRAWVFIANNNSKYGIFYCDYNSVATVHNSGLTVGSGALTGTDGSDGNITVSANAGTFYLENRSGGTHHFGICTLATSP